MPKSRGRRKPTVNRSASRSHRPTSRADLTRLPLLQATDLAEARGDARTAMTLMANDLHRRGDDHFWRPERLARISQIVGLGPLLPRWATSRWIVAQAVQQLDPGMRRHHHKSLQVAIEVRGEQTLVGVDEIDSKAKVMDHDWVYRQMMLYELGGLRRFLARGATPDLVAGADHIHEWAGTPMGAFRLVEETPRTLRWLELGTGAHRESTNIGAASLMAPGECVIGRLVPIDHGAMFETAPLFVPDDVAAEVAAEPSAWVKALAEGCRRPAPGRAISTVHSDFRLLTDVPSFVQMSLALAGVDAEAEVRPGTADQLVALEVRLIRAAMEGRLPPHDLPCSPWPSVAATLLEPAAFIALASSLGPSDDPGLHALAELLPEPAAALCRALAGEDLEVA